MRTSRMIATALAAVVLLTTGAGVASADAPEPDPGSFTVAQGSIVDDAGHEIGDALAIDDGASTFWLVFAQDLPEGLHGLQLHGVGDCSAAFADTGPRVGHAPLAPLAVGPTGTAVTEFETASGDLASQDDTDGFSLVVHDQPDNRANVPTRYQSTASTVAGPDAQTVATGDVGGSIACGEMETGFDVAAGQAEQERAGFTRRAGARMKATAAGRSRAASTGDSESLDLLKADIVGLDGKRRGEVRLLAGPDSQGAITTELRGLEPGAYGIQLHAGGTCTGDAFSDTGARLDGTNLPDVIAADEGDAGGVAFNATTAVLPTLSSLLQGDGTTIVVHTKPDNHANIPARYRATTTGPTGPDATTLATGDAGAGIMCGKLRMVPSAERYIDAVYGTVLGRSVEPSATATWTAFIGRHNRASFVANVTDSVEGRRQFVTQTYMNYAGIEPDPSGLAYWTTQAGRRSFNEDGLIAGLLSTASYYDGAGGDDADYIDDLYLSLLDRDPSSGESSIWRAYLGRGGTRRAVVATLLASPEARASKIDDLYLSTIGRDPELPELAIWLEYLHRGGRFRELRIFLLGGDEFYDLAVTTTGFIDVLV